MCTSSGLITECLTNCLYTPTSYTAFDPRQSVLCAGLEAASRTRNWQDELAASCEWHETAETEPSAAPEIRPLTVAPRHLIGKRHELAPDYPGPARQQGQRRGGGRFSGETPGWSSASQLTNQPGCMAVRMARLGFACAALRLSLAQWLQHFETIVPGDHLLPTLRPELQTRISCRSGPGRA